MAAIETIERKAPTGSKSEDSRSVRAKRAIAIIDVALESSVDEEPTGPSEVMRKTGREIAVERHGERFVADLEARLRGK